MAMQVGQARVTAPERIQSWKRSGVSSVCLGVSARRTCPQQNADKTPRAAVALVDSDELTHLSQAEGSRL